MKILRVPINGVVHQVYTWGKPANPVLLLIHGWMDTGASFEFIAKEISKKFYCVAPDLRGFGKSGHGKNPLGYFFKEYIADVAALAEHFSPQSPVSLLGHSMGGHIVSLYAGTFPERVSRLINVEGFGIRDNPDSVAPLRVREWISSLGKIPPFRVYPSITEVAKRLEVANPRVPLTRLKKMARAMTTPVKNGFVIAADPLHKMREPYLFQLRHAKAFWARIQAQCLLISADKTNMGDWMGKVDLKKEIQKRWACFPKNSKTAVIKNCGHMVHLERPEVLVRLVRQFFA